MRRLAYAALFLIVCPIAMAQMLCHAMAGPGGISPCEKKLAPADNQRNFQKVEWPAIMDNLKTSPGLPFFKQGMTQYYGLNYEEAMRNFKEAKKDPRMSAIASWGIALAAGPNINLNMTGACNKLACDEIERADSLATTERSTLERELISALKKRYVCPVKELSEKEAKDAADKAAKNYSDAMAVIWGKNQKDKNVSTLYAESMMNLNPWDLYDRAGLPKRPETLTIVDVLKNSTGDSPEAIGSNHYYIHAVEGSNPYKGSIHPADAMPSANLLQTQVRDSGHLVHMSSHIYLLVGEYQKSLEANIMGTNNDVGQYSDACRGTYNMYTTNDKCPQLYYGHYVSHNYFFGSVSATFLGQSKNAIAMACDTQAHVQRFVAYEPALQRYLSAPLMTLVVNRNWDAICAETNCKGPNPLAPDFKKPNFEDCYSQGKEVSGCYVLRAIWYWARGMARAAYGVKDNADLRAMNADYTAMNVEIDTIEKIDPCSENHRTSRNTFGNNCAKDVLKIGNDILAARIQWASLDSLGPLNAKSSLIAAVKAEDELVYDEPPQWFTPAREALGGFYLQAAEDSGARKSYYEEASRIFEEALARHPASGRALYGKMRALQGQGKVAEAADAEKAFLTAWTGDYTMTDADLWPDKNVSKPLKVVSGPSKCACQATTWPPPSNAKDLPAGDVIGDDVHVNYALLNCLKKATK